MTLEAWAERNPLIDHPFPRPPPLPVESTGDTTTTPQEAVMTTDFPTPELAERPEQHLAVVRETLPMDGIRDHYDRAFPLIFNSLGKAGVSPSGPAMAVTHGMPAETIDLSAAVPVTDPISADGDVTPEVLPAGRAVTLLVRGSYDLIGAAYGHLFDWVNEQGLTPTGLAWEQYLTEPTPDGDPADNETLLGAYVE